jgi:hypothetical protein
MSLSSSLPLSLSLSLSLFKCFSCFLKHSLCSFSSLSLFFYLIANSSASLNQLNRVPGEIVSYSFQRSDCLQGKFSQESHWTSLLSDLSFDQSEYSCPKSNGIQVSSEVNESIPLRGLISNHNLTNFLQYLNEKSSFTIEFWIGSLEFTQSSSQSLLSISSSTFPSCQALEVGVPPMLCHFH